MRTRIVIAVTLLWLWPIAGGALSNEPSQTPAPEQREAASTQPVKGKPQAFFPKANYVFEEVLEGGVVMHDFVLQNRGNAPLDVKEVKTS